LIRNQRSSVQSGSPAPVLLTNFNLQKGAAAKRRFWVTLGSQFDTVSRGQRLPAHHHLVRPLEANAFRGMRMPGFTAVALAIFAIPIGCDYRDL
jgi:hypothetical protein